jgi:hypothetical protein
MFNRDHHVQVINRNTLASADRLILDNHKFTSFAFPLTNYGTQLVRVCHISDTI